MVAGAAKEWEEVDWKAARMEWVGMAVDVGLARGRVAREARVGTAKAVAMAARSRPVGTADKGHAFAPVVRETAPMAEADLWAMVEELAA